jgi:very-short-patch-repair endonuclease
VWEHHLTEITPGEVKTFFCVDVSETFSALDFSCISSMGNIRLVSHKWNHLPDLTTIISDTLTALAKVAQALWPCWYSLKAGFLMPVHGNLLEYAIADYLKVAELVETRKRVSSAWLKAAITCGHSEKIPFPAGFRNAVQAEQLALTIDPDNLLILLAVTELQPAKDKLLGLAKSAEWLAKETKSRIAVLIPQNVCEASELESILYGATTVLTLEHASIQSKANEEERLLFGPVHGTPHPFSPGEQKLARNLQSDPELSNLFHFNQSIITNRESRYLVDLVWEKGKVVVEVDGYAYHSNRTAFKLDRHRDYELSISGYIVLRLPHDEIMLDVALVMEKIRDVVRFRQKTVTPD